MQKTFAKKTLLLQSFFHYANARNKVNTGTENICLIKYCKQVTLHKVWIEPQVKLQQALSVCRASSRVGTLFSEMVIFPYQHCGCLWVRKLRGFKTSDPLKSLSVKSNT